MLVSRSSAVPAAGASRRRGRLLRVAAVLAVAAGFLAVPAQAASVPALTTRTTITGSRTAWTRVTLTRSLPVDGAPRITVDNPKAFVGVALVREKSYEPEAAYIVRHETGAGTAYRYGWAGKVLHNGDRNFPMYVLRVLPAGTYRMYLLATGPVKATVTWALPGGRTSTFRAGNATTSYDTQAMAPGVPGVAVAPAHALSARHQMARRSLLVGYSWFAGSVSAVESFGGCKMEADDPAPMVPACPGGGANLLGVNVVTATGGISIGHRYVGAGNWLNKTYYMLGGHLTDGGNALYWLDLGAGFPA